MGCTMSVGAANTFIYIFFTAGQAGNTAGQGVRGNCQACYGNRQAGKCIGQICFISPTHSLSGMGTACIKDPVGAENASFGFSTPTEDKA